eukprot:3545936-Rhodomonas_salina.2
MVWSAPVDGIHALALNLVLGVRPDVADHRVGGHGAALVDAALLLDESDARRTGRKEEEETEKREGEEGRRKEDTEQTHRPQPLPREATTTSTRKNVESRASLFALRAEHRARNMHHAASSITHQAARPRASRTDQAAGELGGARVLAEQRQQPLLRLCDLARALVLLLPQHL